MAYTYREAVIRFLRQLIVFARSQRVAHGSCELVDALGTAVCYDLRACLAHSQVQTGESRLDVP